MAFKLNSGNNPSFKMMGADSPKKKMETPMDMGHSPKKMKSPMDAPKPDYLDMDGDGNKEESMKQAVKDKKSGLNMKTPMDMKTPMELEMEKESAMQLKSAMDMAKDGPMNMGVSPKKLTTDAAMKMSAAMKKFYNN